MAKRKSGVDDKICNSISTTTLNTIFYKIINIVIKL